MHLYANAEEVRTGKTRFMKKNHSMYYLFDHHLFYIIAYIFVTLFINLDRHKKKGNYNCFYRFFLYTLDFINTLL